MYCVCRLSVQRVRVHLNTELQCTVYVACAPEHSELQRTVCLPEHSELQCTVCVPEHSELQCTVCVPEQ